MNHISDRLLPIPDDAIVLDALSYLTTNSPRSSYDVPVLMFDGDVLGPADLMPSQLSDEDTARQYVIDRTQYSALSRNPMVAKFISAGAA